MDEHFKDKTIFIFNILKSCLLEISFQKETFSIKETNFHVNKLSNTDRSNGYNKNKIAFSIHMKSKFKAKEVKTKIF